MKTLLASIAKTLLQKNIAFAIYRFPNRQEIHLAIDSQYLPHPKKLTFWMAPFSDRSKAENIYWSVVQQNYINNDFLKIVESLPAQAPLQAPFPLATTKEDYFDRIQAYLKDMHAGKLNKAILSRVFYEQKPKDFDAVDCFFHLTSLYPETFAHLSLHPSSGIWMGATPELLLHKNVQEWSIMALAGTQARKEVEEYTWREKEMEEHLMVGQHIESVFANYQCDLIKRDGPHTIERARVAHLSTDYIFKEHKKIEIQLLLKNLHPTPAVGGLPVDAGEDCIWEHEGYDRRYYCGFIGTSDFDEEVNLYINLRCMQIGEYQIAIYVGGGITAASNADEEWQETILKSKTMVEAIHYTK